MTQNVAIDTAIGAAGAAATGSSVAGALATGGELALPTVAGYEAADFVGKLMWCEMRIYNLASQ